MQNAQATYSDYVPLSQMPLPSPAGTLAIIAAAAVALFGVTQGSSSEAMARQASIIMGIGIGVSMLADMKQGGLRNLLRADLLALFATYFLVLFEFLMPQPVFNTKVAPNEVGKALPYVYLGFVSLAIGRHLIKPKPYISRLPTFPTIPLNGLMFVFFAALLVGNLYRLIAVDFNVIQIFDEMLNKPRMERSWGRGRFGDWNALLHEVGMINYILAPIYGLVLARVKEANKFMFFLMTLGFLYTLFAAFSSGTRFILAANGLMFLMAYMSSFLKLSFIRVALVSGLVAGLFGFFSYHMLEFRGVGLASYVQSGQLESDSGRDSYHVDLNLWTISKLVSAVPERKPYVGLDIPVYALIKPVPRAIWPGKPMGTKANMAEVLGLSDAATYAVTWVGEAYWVGGPLSIILHGLFFGAFASFWNRYRLSAIKSNYGLAVFAAGIFGIGIAMRSTMELTTYLLPAIALIVMAKMMPASWRATQSPQPSQNWQPSPAITPQRATQT